MAHSHVPLSLSLCLCGSPSGSLSIALFFGSGTLSWRCGSGLREAPE